MMRRTGVRLAFSTVGWVLILLVAVAITRSLLIPLFLGSLIGLKLSLSDEATAPPDARCGASCSACISYHRGHCPSCAFGPEQMRVSCPIFQCAEKKQTVCTECPEMLHCSIYREYAEKCPFRIPEVQQDTLPEGGFLIKETCLNKSLNFFADRIARGDLGLIILRQPPHVLAEWQLLRKVPVVQLMQTMDHGSHIDPTNLAKLHLTIQEFFEAAPRTTVLLEGMEYLIVHNGISRVMKFIHSIAECATTHSSRFITIIDPRILDDEEMVSLERELKCVNSRI